MSPVLKRDQINIHTHSQQQRLLLHFQPEEWEDQFVESGGGGGDVGDEVGDATDRQG